MDNNTYNLRYAKNEKALSPEENQSLRNFSVAVVGCGGLGGYIIEELARLGIGTITAIDGDVFDETNLNRQLLSDVENIGTSKVLAAKSRMLRVNPEIKLIAVEKFLDDNNAIETLKGHHVICDGLDNISSRQLIKNTCRKLAIPYVYGAIAGWYGHVSTIFPEDNELDFIFDINQDKGIEKFMGNPSFTPAIIASLQVAETIKILTKKGELLRKKLLMVDCLENKYEIIHC